jgi:hypothetical protein
VSTGQEKEKISHTRMVAFRACRHRHHLAYELGVKPIAKALQLVVGTAMHLWLEAWWLVAMADGAPRWLSPVRPPEQDPEREDAMLMPVEAAFHGLGATDPYEAAKLRAMVLAYHLRWGSQQIKVYSVEAEFTAPLINPLDGKVSKRYERTGKIDAIVEFPESAGPEFEGEWVMEHKSRAGAMDVGDKYFRKLRMDPQISDYHIGAAALGHEIRGVIYDVVCKPTIEPRMATPEADRKMTIGVGCRKCGGGKDEKGSGYEGAADRLCRCQKCDGTGWKDAPHYYANVRLEDETPGEYGLRCFTLMLSEPLRYFHRHKVTRLADELRDHEIDGWFTVRSMHEQRATGVAPRNPDACWLFNRPCDYTAICWDGARADDERLFRISKRPKFNVIDGDME